MKPIPKKDNLSDPGNSGDNEAVPSVRAKESAIRQDGSGERIARLVDSDATAQLRLPNSAPWFAE